MSGLEGVAKFSIYILFLSFNLQVVVGPDLQEIRGCTSPFSAGFDCHLALAQAGGWVPTAYVGTVALWIRAT